MVVYCNYFVGVYPGSLSQQSSSALLIQTKEYLIIYSDNISQLLVIYQCKPNFKTMKIIRILHYLMSSSWQAGQGLTCKGLFGENPIYQRDYIPGWGLDTQQLQSWCKSCEREEEMNTRKLGLWWNSWVISLRQRVSHRRGMSHYRAKMGCSA